CVRREDWRKVTYLLSQKPVSRVMGKTMQSVAICGVMQKTAALKDKRQKTKDKKAASARESRRCVIMTG
ncbi:MAG: hypothetical protein IJR74_01555, partial [Paludibacteraceae bacterium]|nr:hypothetical protein [Paludibacteraceae bacterium]